MICKKLNKSFKCCRFTVIINPILRICPYYISSKDIIYSSKRIQGYKEVYNLYKNFDIVVFWNSSLDFLII